MRVLLVPILLLALGLAPARAQTVRGAELVGGASQMSDAGHQAFGVIAGGPSGVSTQPTRILLTGELGSFGGQPAGTGPVPPTSFPPSDNGNGGGGCQAADRDPGSAPLALLLVAAFAMMRRRLPGG